MSTKKRFQTYLHRPHFAGESNSSPSLTVPSKSLSLKELIKRDLAHMITPTGGVEPYYDDTMVIPDFKKMDLVDIDIWKETLDARLKEVNADIKYEKAERVRRDREAAAASSAAPDETA